MSLRALRKLEQQRLEKSKATAIPEEETEALPIVSSQTKSFNAFDFLEGEDDSGDDHEVQPKQEDVKPQVPKPKKSNKKKNKKKNKTAISPPVDSDEELDRILEAAKLRDKQSLSNEPEEIEEYFQEPEFDFESEFNEIDQPLPDFDSNFKNFTTERLKQSLPLLSIQSAKNIDSENELKNLFGSLSLETIEDANSTAYNNTKPEVLSAIKSVAKATKGWAGKDKRSIPGTTQKLLMTRIKDDYIPTSTRNITMELLSTKKAVEYLDYKEETAEHDDIEYKIMKEKRLGVKYFRFRKIVSQAEIMADTQFYAGVVISPNTASLAYVLGRDPYHVEALLQMGIVMLRQGNDKTQSHSYVELSLFNFDRSLHKQYHALLLEAKNGLARLPYECYMNRQFYLTLFRYLVGLGERSMFFTALTYCKLLLSLSPAEDPLGVRYFIDFYAIKSEEYSYLIRLSDSPLVTSYSKWLTPGIAFSTVLAHLALNNNQEAVIALRRAYKAYPFTAYKLLEDIGLPSVMPVSESDVFVNDELALASETYLVRAKLLWNDSEKRKFLSEELCKLFLEDKKAQAATSGTLASKLMGLFFKTKEPSASNEVPFNLIRFAILSGESSVMGKVPASIWERDDTYEYDVLPPQSSTLTYGIEGQEENGLIDYLIDYVDQDVLATIIQRETGADFDDLIQEAQEEQEQEQEEQGQ